MARMFLVTMDGRRKMMSNTLIVPNRRWIGVEYLRGGEPTTQGHTYT